MLPGAWGIAIPMDLQVSLRRINVKTVEQRIQIFENRKGTREIFEAQWCIQRVHVGDTMIQARVGC